MQSEDLELQLVRNTELANIQRTLKYAVRQGPSSQDWVAYPASSTTNSSIQFQVQPPSENSAISRCFLIETVYNFQVKISAAAGSYPNNYSPFVWGLNAATQAFPFNQNIVTATLNINGHSNSISTQDVLPQLLRLMDSEELQELCGLTPSLVDKFRLYKDGLTLPCNPLGGINISSHNEFLLPRGVHPIEELAFTSDPAGVTTGKWGNANTQSITASFKITIVEPLFISPLIFKRYPNNDQAFIGVQGINVNLSTDAKYERFFSINTTAANRANDNVVTATVTTTGQIVKSTLYLHYMSLQPGHSIESRNILPYMEYARYPQTIKALGGDGAVGAKATKETTINSNAIQVSQMPDKIIIAVRPESRPSNVADYYLPITNVNFTLGTQSGLLSTASPFQLYQLSCDAGLKMSWYEWSGLVNTENGNLIKTVGSILVIDPTMLNLPEYLAPGSNGQFNISFKITVRNDTGNDFDGQMITILCNSGAYVIQSGKASSYLQLLDKASVISLNEEQGQNAMSKAQLDRMVGGAGLSDSVVNGLQDLHIVQNKKGGSRSGGRKSKLDQFLL